MLSTLNSLHGRTLAGIEGFVPPELPKLDLPTDAECVATDGCNCNSAVYCMGILYLHNDIFLTAMTG